MTRVTKIPKLKEDLSNVIYSFSINDLEKLRNIHRNFSDESYEQFLDKLLTKEEKSEIKEGYAIVKNNMLYSCMPNYFMKHGLKQIFDVEVVHEERTNES